MKEEKKQPLKKYFKCVIIVDGKASIEKILTNAEIIQLRIQLKKQKINAKIEIGENVSKPKPIKMPPAYDNIPLDKQGFKFILRSRCCMERVISQKLICDGCEKELKPIDVLIFTEVEKVNPQPTLNVVVNTKEENG